MARKTWWLSKHYTYLIYFFYLCTMNGLTVKNGRLINEGADGKTGIQQAAQIRKDLKQAKKIAMITEAINLAQSKKNLMSR